MAARRFSSVPDAVSTTTSQSGAASRSRGSALRPPSPGIERSRRIRSGRSSAARAIASSPSEASPATSKPCCWSNAASAERVSGWSSTRRMRSATARTLIGRAGSADKGSMRQDAREDFQAWLWGQVLLFGLLGASLALFVTKKSLPTHWPLPELRLVLQATVALACGLIALLAGVRYAVEARRRDLLLATGFFVASLSTLAFSVAPVLGGHGIHRTEGWANVVGLLLAWALIARAPFAHGRAKAGRRALGNATMAAAILLLLVWSIFR